MKKINYIKHPSLILLWLDNKKIITLGDKRYLRLRYFQRLGEWPDFKHPEKFSEKLQVLKIVNRNPDYVKMVDKYEAKKYVGKLIGNKHIIKTLGVYNDWDEIDFSRIPEKFVIKCTHDSGSVIVCRNKKDFDLTSAKKIISKALKTNYYRKGREWQYKNVKPRILIEEYMQDKNTNSLNDYKFFCFNGEPKLMYMSEGMENHKTAQMSYYDMDFKLTSCRRRDYKPLDHTPKKPTKFEEMKKFARKLSAGIPFLRVDFYEINGKVYFGELTFYPSSGCIPFEDVKWDRMLGDWIRTSDSLMKKDPK